MPVVSSETFRDLLVMSDEDNVATALRDLEAGDTCTYIRFQREWILVLMDPIPFGHKVAIEPIAEGSYVRKYGEVIGRATVLIACGHHVHVHNVEGLRGRGDIHHKGDAS